MIKLTPENYNCVTPLVDACQLHGHLAFAYAVLEFRQNGRVFVDNKEHVSYALVCNDLGFFLAFGHPLEEDGIAQVHKLCMEPLVEENSALFGTSAEWDAVLEAAFPMGRSKPIRRMGFVYRPIAGRPPRNWRELIPAGYRMEPITTHLAEKIIDGSGTGGFGIDPWFIRVAGGPAMYASRQLGYAIMHGDQIASLCGYCGLGHGEAELEVGTVPTYKGKGLATLASAAFIEQCEEKGWLPVYTCDSVNLPSIAVAHKLGFTEVEEILGYKIEKPHIP